MVKRILPFFLVILLLCGTLPVTADETLPYMEMFLNDVPYMRYVYLTSESCPQVCISPNSATLQYEWSSPHDPVYVMFPTPPGNTYCKAFYVHHATYKDLDGGWQYDYAFRSDYWTDEKFLEKCSDPSLILMDGSGGAAAYISPDWGAAYALMAVNGLDTGDRLEITVTMQDYSKLGTEDRITQLSSKIREEISRIQAEATVALLGRFWTDGAYRGIRIFDRDYPDIKVTMEFTEITFHTAGDGEISGKMFLTSYSDGQFECYAVEEPGKAVSLDFTVSDWSVFYSDPDNTVIYTLEDGTEWGFCMEIDVDGSPKQAYGSTVIYEDEEDTVYLTIRISTSSSHYYWPDMETLVRDIGSVMESVSISNSTVRQPETVAVTEQPVTEAPVVVTEPPAVVTEPPVVVTEPPVVVTEPPVVVTEPPVVVTEPPAVVTEAPAASAPSVNGWQERDGEWYWTAADGSTATGWQEIDGVWYYFHGDGRLETTLFPFVSDDPGAGGDICYSFPCKNIQRLGFKTSDIANDNNAAFFIHYMMRDYEVALNNKKDPGMLFYPEVNSHPVFIGTDGSCINLLVESPDTNKMFFIFFDTRTNQAFTHYAWYIPEDAEKNFSIMCPDGTREIPQLTIYSIYLYIQGL